MKKQTVAISIGDLNGVGLQIALNSHKEISKLVSPIYCINSSLLAQGSKLLGVDIPKDFTIYETKGEFTIKPSKISQKSGRYSYDSYIDAIKLTQNGKADAVMTLPIHKEAWSKAGISYKGHTEVLRDIYQKNAIMMLGCQKMFVALYTEHIPLKDVPKYIKKSKIKRFLLDFYKEVKSDNIAVLGLNPHAGDGGVLGDEEIAIDKAIKETNKKLKKDIFKGSLVPDTAFTPSMREKFKYYVVIYHDQGLTPLKSLYFDESINVSLNLPILRASVDHGTAFDIAYSKTIPNNQSYINAIKYIVEKTNLP
jgi:4-hydroxythreonine-4-phosphate dehydrogenase